MTRELWSKIRIFDGLPFFGLCLLDGMFRRSCLLDYWRVRL